MATGTSDHLLIALDQMRAELAQLMEKASKLQNLIMATEDYVGKPAPPPLFNGQKPSVRTGLVTVIRESGNRGWLLADLADTLFKRGWLGGKNGKPSKETVRQALHDLQKQGILTSERQGAGQWAPSLWKLSNNMLTRSPDLS